MPYHIHLCLGIPPKQRVEHDRIYQGQKRDSETQRASWNLNRKQHRSVKYMDINNTPPFETHNLLISVIIRTKDRPALLAEAMESVAQQKLSALGAGGRQ